MSYLGIDHVLFFSIACVLRYSNVKSQLKENSFRLPLHLPHFHYHVKISDGVFHPVLTDTELQKAWS